MRKCYILILGCLLFAYNGHAQTWKINDEVEVHPGRYVTLYDSFDSWDIWKIETKSGITCHGRKFEQGKRQLPNETIFFSMGAGLGLDLTREGEVYWSIHHRASSAYGNAEYRFSGDKSPTDLVKASYVNYGDKLLKNQTQLQELKAREGEKVTLYTSDWEYRAAKVGYEELEANIALKGITQAESQLVACKLDNA